jgi:hypothetical protein
MSESGLDPAYSNAARSQVAFDADRVAAGWKVDWYFVRSALTGKQGGSAALEAALRDMRGSVSFTSRRPLDWGSYRPLEAAEGVRIDADPVRGSWEVLTRAAARERYSSVMAVRTERMPMLLDLALRNGYAAGIDDEQGWAELNRFFLERLPVNESPDAETGAELVTLEWVSVTWDLALAIGESAMQRHPHLRWELYEPGQRNVIGIHNPAIMGHRDPAGDPTLPFLFLEGYVLEICRPPRPYLFEAKGHVITREPDPVRQDLFLTLNRAEDHYAVGRSARGPQGVDR